MKSQHINALWLERFYKYKQSPKALVTAENIITYKIQRQSLCVQEPIEHKIPEITDVEALLLREARAARKYWGLYRKQLPAWTYFSGRKPRAKDVVNMLLDIGYHHLNNKIDSLLSSHNIPSGIGLLHVPHRSASRPLVYDLMELFRADVVDQTLLHFLRLKKRPIENVSQKEIGIFLSRINKKLNKLFYLQSFKQCHSYHYYMELQILKFMKAVNTKEVFTPIILPSRNEHRCKNK